MKNVKNSCAQHVCFLFTPDCLTAICTHTPVPRSCSQASANQRTGRAGRVSPGKCFRLCVPLSFVCARRLKSCVSPGPADLDYLHSFAKVTAVCRLITWPLTGILFHFHPASHDTTRHAKHRRYTAHAYAHELEENTVPEIQVCCAAGMTDQSPRNSEYFQIIAHFSTHRQQRFGQDKN